MINGDLNYLNYFKNGLSRKVDFVCVISSDMFVDVIEPCMNLPSEADSESESAWTRATLFERLPPYFDFLDVREAFYRSRRTRKVEYVTGRNPSIPDAGAWSLAVFVSNETSNIVTEWIYARD